MLLPEKVHLDHASHIYTDDSELIYQSTSKFVEGFSEPFNQKMLAEMTAKKRKRVVEDTARDRKISIPQAQSSLPKFSRGITTQQVIQEWEAKRDEAANAGTFVHNLVENYIKTGQITDERYTDYCHFIQKILAKYHSFYSEEILYNEEYMVAGTSDLILQRTKSKQSVMDITDFKTNYNGFTYNSISTDQYTGQRKHNNRYFLDPIGHVEKSYFTKTCLQLSKYMWMLEQQGFKPGCLYVILLDWRLQHKPKVVHIPYMKLEIEAMLNHKPF